MIARQADGRERAFGVTVGSVLLAIAAYQIWQGRMVVAAILAATGGVLVVLGLTWPAVLRRPSDAWWRLSYVLAYINTRVLLTVIFLVLLVPIGLIWRAIGRDPLGRRRASAGWAPYPARYRDREHYRRMY